MCKQINRASDDPACLMVLQSLGSQPVAIRKEINRLERESMVAGARGGALSVVSDLPLNLDSLVVRAANKCALSVGERESLQGQADAIVDAVRFSYDTATFSGERLFAGQSSPGRTCWPPRP